jgi:hypothetical protein
MSRYPPPARDRSPPRFDRRPSNTFAPNSSSRDPPRGPKADFRGGGFPPFSSAPRGGRGGFSNRPPSDSWDRERDRERDARPPPQSYRAREDDRSDWSRRDRDFPPSDRPPATVRDVRPYPPRDRSASPVRQRRDSRESLPPALGRVPDSSSSYYGSSVRGGLSRGRGRGDWDRGRGRSSFIGDRERELFPRSRSRESWRERDFERGRPAADAERSERFDRRDVDRSRERDVRAREGRDHDVWPRDSSPASRTGVNVSSGGSGAVNDRPRIDADLGRRASVIATPSSTPREGRRDLDSNDYFASARVDGPRREPPPAATAQASTAALGLDYGPPPSVSAAATPIAERLVAVKTPATRPEPARISPAPFQPPSGPKAVPSRAPIAPASALKPSTMKPQQVKIEPARTSPVLFQPPSGPKAERTTVALHSASIPTGPRVEREPLKPSNIWTAGDRPVPTGPRVQAAFQRPRMMPNGPNFMATSPRPQETKMTLLPPRRPDAADPRIDDDGEISESSSDEGEDEDLEDDSFDEEYFAESEERHKQELRLLEARKPPPILEDSGITSLLIRIQFLDMILAEDNAINRTGDIVKQETQTPAIVPTLPSPQIPLPASPEVNAQHSDKRSLRDPVLNPMLTPPLESLPYRIAGAPQRMIFEDSDNEVEHEAVDTLLHQDFEQEAWDRQMELEEMRMEFKSLYPKWKHEVNSIEAEQRELQASPAPASPAPSVPPSVPASLTHERTRGARNATEADYEAALALSKQSAKEEEERREREAAASSVPNPEMEATLPEMLTQAETELCQFEDTNNIVARDLIKHCYSYEPPRDDFTAEEQEKFIQAYCMTPKKWGKIAEPIPGRTYKECITHYYLTKDSAKYKEIWRRSLPKGRRGRAKGLKQPRSTALMSELLRGDEVEGTPVAMTDSGRPRRAAAPTFGDVAVGEGDHATPAPQAKRTAASATTTDPAVPKAKGRRTAVGGKTAKRTKAQAQAPTEQPLNSLMAVAEGSPLKPAGAGKGDKNRMVIRDVEPLPTTRIDLLPAVAPQTQRMEDLNIPQYPITDPALAALGLAPTASAVTSYWSVPEQHKFPQLVAYFGKDFGAIADFMKTKSPTMVRPQYALLYTVSDSISD